MIKKVALILLSIILLSSCTEDLPQIDSEDDIIVNEQKTSFRLVAEECESLLPVDNIKKSLADALFICYEPLFDFDEALNPIPLLASASQKQNDTRYLITLKDGVKWHDGTDFTAHDVSYSVKKLKSGENLYSKELENIKNVEIVDNKRLVFNLNSPTVNFEGLLCFPIVKSGAIFDGYDFSPVGTGPYKFSERKNNTLVFSKNENWHGGVASDKTIHLNLMKDKSSAVYAFEANELDIITDSMMDLSQITPKGNTETFSYISNNLLFLGMNNTEGVLASSEVRKAISYLIDRDELLKNNFYSRGVAVEVPIYPKAWFYDKENDSVLVSTSGDYLKTQLTNDGWLMKNGYYTKDFGEYSSELTLSLLVNKDSEDKVLLAEGISDILSKNGIMVKLKKVSYEDYLAKIRDMDYSLFIGEISMGKNMDPSRILKNGENYFGYESEAMAEVLADLNLSQKENLTEKYSKFTEQFLVDMPFVPLAFRENAMIFAKNLAGYGTPTYYKAYRNVENWYFTKRVD